MSTIQNNTSTSNWIATRQEQLENTMDLAMRLGMVAGSVMNYMRLKGFDSLRLNYLNEQVHYYGDALWAFDIINVAYWWKNASTKTWQHTAGMVVVSFQQILGTGMFMGYNFAEKMGMIGHVPVLGAVMSLCRCTHWSLRFWHNIRVLNESDAASEAVKDNLTRLNAKIAPLRARILPSNVFNSFQYLSPTEQREHRQLTVEIDNNKSILEHNKTKAIFSMIHCVNNVALGIFTLSVLISGGALAAATSPTLILFALYVQSYGVFNFLHGLYSKPHVIT